LNDRGGAILFQLNGSTTSLPPFTQCHRKYPARLVMPPVPVENFPLLFLSPLPLASDRKDLPYGADDHRYPGQVSPGADRTAASSACRSRASSMTYQLRDLSIFPFSSLGAASQAIRQAIRFANISSVSCRISCSSADTPG